MTEKPEYQTYRRVSIVRGLDYKPVISYLKLPKKLRSESMTDYLKLLIFKLKILSDISEDYKETAAYDFCESLEYSCKEKGENLYKTEESSYFYIILKGEVLIESSSSSTILTDGGCFAEFLGNSINTLSAKTLQNTHFAVVEKNKYFAILQKFSIQNLEASANWLKQIPMFKGMTNKVLMNFSSHFSIVNLEWNNVLYEEGDPANNVYIVKTGEVEFIKTISTNKQQIKSIGKYGRPMVLPEIKTPKSVRFHICIKGELEVIGDEEAMNDCCRKFSCRCYSSTCQLIQIPKTEFKKRVKIENQGRHTFEIEKGSADRLSKMMSIMNYTNSRSSLDRPDPLLKKKVVKDLKKIDPWKISKGLVVSSDRFKKALGKNSLNELRLSSINVMKSASALLISE